MRTKSAARSRILGVLVAVCVAVGLSIVPGVAAAAAPHVSPVVDCHRLDGDGTHTLVLGYVNTHPMVRNQPYGNDNQLFPSTYQGAQPTRLEPGTHSGVFSLRLTEAEFAEFRWNLGRDSANRQSAASAAVCAPATPLPALGNGTGLAIALVAGGAFGVWFVRRVIRRAAVPAGTPSA